MKDNLASGQPCVVVEVGSSTKKSSIRLRSLAGRQPSKSFLHLRAPAGRQTSLPMHIGTQLVTHPQGFGVSSRFRSHMDHSGPHYFLIQGHVERIEEMLVWSFHDRLQGKVGENRRKNFMNWIMECIRSSDAHHPCYPLLQVFFCRFSDLITIFDIRTEENLDKKILAALLKGDELRLQSQVKFEEDKNNLFERKQFTCVLCPDVPCHGLEQG